MPRRAHSPPLRMHWKMCTPFRSGVRYPKSGDNPPWTNVLVEKEPEEERMRRISYNQASVEALQEEFRRNDRLGHLAEDIHPELFDEVGGDRVRMTPIS